MICPKQFVIFLINNEKYDKPRLLFLWWQNKTLNLRHTHTKSRVIITKRAKKSDEKTKCSYPSKYLIIQEGPHLVSLKMTASLS